ncbi:formyltetrahydrofolate deformylase [Kocuria sp. KH4]
MPSSAPAGSPAAEELLVVGGDPGTPQGPYEDSLAVIRSGALQRHGVRRVGIGGCPEGHPAVDDDVLWAALAARTTALREQGLEATVVTPFGLDTAGPDRFLDDLAAGNDAGVHGPVRLHFYTFGRLGATACWVRRFGGERVAVFASRSDHCLLDLIWRQRRGQLPMTISMVVPDHPDLAQDVRGFGIPFFHVPAGDRAAAEAEHLRLLDGNVDLVVLARCMQILSAPFLEAVGVPVINIHHSFLPAFVGAEPYRKAKERGVKIIGATAHYVTEDLDEGPIIEQDVVRVSHRDTAQDLARRGADVERQVLARAVLWHCQDRVVRHDRQTIVF